MNYHKSIITISLIHQWIIIKISLKYIFKSLMKYHWNINQLPFLQIVPPISLCRSVPISVSIFRVLYRSSECCANPQSAADPRSGLSSAVYHVLESFPPWLARVVNTEKFHQIIIKVSFNYQWIINKISIKYH